MAGDTLMNAAVESEVVRLFGEPAPRGLRHPCALKRPPKMSGTNMSR
jgi:hypothetical protein